MNAAAPAKKSPFRVAWLALSLLVAGCDSPGEAARHGAAEGPATAHRFSGSYPIQVTATSGLTRDEIKNMIDNAKEHMVERRVSEEFEGLKQEAQRLAAEIEKLFPQVEQIVAASDFGREAIDKARGIVTRARTAIDKKDAAALKEHIEGLSRTQRMFKGVVAKGQ